MATTYKFPTIVKGSTGGHVATVQSILKARGFVGEDGKPLEIDGDAGNNTMFAIAAYIKARSEQGVDLGAPNGWGPLCYADQNWPKA